MVVVTPDKITNLIWRNFYDTISANVESVMIRGKGGSETHEVEVQHIKSAFPSIELSEADNYPIIIISPPTSNFSNLTFRKKMDTGRIEIEVNATQIEAADRLKDLINYTLMSAEDTFRTYGIKNLLIEDEDNSQVSRGQLNIHVRRLAYSFDYSFQI